MSLIHQSLTCNATKFKLQTEIYPFSLMYEDFLFFDSPAEWMVILTMEFVPIPFAYQIPNTREPIFQWAKEGKEVWNKG